MTSGTNTEMEKEEEEQRRRRKEIIYKCCKQLQQQWSIDIDIDDLDNEEEDLDKLEEGLSSNDDNNDFVGVSTTMLQDTLVPAMKDLLTKQEELREQKAMKQQRYEWKQIKNANDNLVNNETDNENIFENDIKVDNECMEMILECFAGYVSMTDSSNFKNINDTKEEKNSFITTGAFEMTMHVLRQYLEEYNEANQPSDDQNKINNNDNDVIGTDIVDNTEQFPLDDGNTNTPSSKIPQLVLTILAHLTYTASDALKNDRVLPVLTIVHECMKTFLADSTIQGFGTWILHNLSNPLLQELVAAGSLSVIVNAMKCHPADPLVQEHGNAALYNLLPLVLNNPNNRLEIDRLLYREISSLLLSLPAIVLRGMEQNPTNLSIQQYGLLTLNRICQKDQEHYEVFVSENGLTTLLNNLKMTTTNTFDQSNVNGVGTVDGDDNYDVLADGGGGGENYDTNITADTSIIEKRDCLAQLSCQFLRDLSRPTNSSMDILYIICVKGGIAALIHLLQHYNEEVETSAGTNNNANATTTSACNNVINIIDPAMACIRNLFCSIQNIKLVLADDYDNHHVIPTVLHTMDCFSHDAAIQAYGCDILGRLAQTDTARREITNTTVTVTPTTAYHRSSSMAQEVDAMITVLRAMINHRSHAGVQERAVVLLWALIVHDTKHSSSLISRIREVYVDQEQLYHIQTTTGSTKNGFVMKDFVVFLEETVVTQRGLDRLEELADAVDQYEQGKVPVVSKRRSPTQAKENTTTGNIKNIFFKGWSKLTGEQEGTVLPT